LLPRITAARHLCLIDGVLHAFEPYSPAVATAGKPRTVANGVNIGRRGGGTLIDQNAVVAGKSRRGRKLIVRAGAGRDQDEIHGQEPNGCEMHLQSCCRRLDRHERYAEPDVDTTDAMDVGKESGSLFAHDPLHQPCFRFD
jgi:hypothetical protein